MREPRDTWLIKGKLIVTYLYNLVKHNVLLIDQLVQWKHDTFLWYNNWVFCKLRNLFLILIYRRSIGATGNYLEVTEYLAHSDVRANK